MKPVRILILVTSLGVLLGILYPFLITDDEARYQKEMQTIRTDRDEYMRNGKDSPFAGTSAPFTGLQYFPVSAGYRIQADLEIIQPRETRSLPTSDGKSRTFLTYGWARFDLGGRNHSLLILENLDGGPDRGKLFLAFTDETSAGESYGGGRYLDVNKVAGATSLLLDFNRAYNPYCAYNNSFSCPFPPPENHLSVQVNAGEKNYH